MFVLGVGSGHLPACISPSFRGEEEEEGEEEGEEKEDEKWFGSSLTPFFCFKA